MGIEKLKENNITEILLMPYSHHDYEWVCTRAWHKWRYIKAFCDVLDVMKEDPDYTWHIDNIVHSWTPFVKYCPERVDEFVKYVKEGRICVLNGGVSLARPSQVSEETYIRNMMEGRRMFREQFGIDDFPVLYNADTASGHSQLPQIARLGGHKYYRFQRPDNLLTKKGVPMQFWWEGLDGSRLLTTRGLYGGFWNEVEWLNWDAETKWDEKREKFYEQVLSDKVNDNRSTDVVFQFVGCDDCRPKRDIHDVPHDVNKFAEEWNAREPSKMRYITLNDAYRLLETKDVPEWKGVLDHAELTYNFPQKGMHSMWRRRIELDRLITQVEKLYVIAETLGIEYPAEQIRRLWLDLFEITGHAIEDIQARDNQELQGYADRALQTAQVMLRNVKDDIITAVTKQDKLQAVVVSTLNWESEQVVRFQVSNYCGIAGFDIVDAQGNVLPYQVVDYFPEYRAYEGSEYAGVDVEVKVKVPAMGYTTVDIVPNGTSLKEKVEATFIDNLPSGLPADTRGSYTMDNGVLEATFHNGALVSLVNKKTGRRIEADATHPAVALRFEELNPSTSWISDVHNILNVWEFVPQHGKVLANGPVRFTYKAYGVIKDQPASITYTLNQDSKGLDLRVETDFKEAIEGIFWFSVRADAAGDVFADIPFGTEKREFFDNIRVDPITNEPIAVAPGEWEYPGQIYARNWVSFLSGKDSVALIGKNCGCYFNYDRDAKEMKLVLTRALPMKYRTDRWFGECPAAFDVTGQQIYDMSIFFADKHGQFTDIQRYHKQMIYPAVADQKFGFAGGGFAPETASMLDTDKKNIINTAVYKEDGKMIARFFECEGRKTDAVITLPKGAKKVRAVDFCGNTLPDVKVFVSHVRGTVKVSFGAFKIVTLEIK